MPLLYEEALRLSQEDRQRGIIEEIIDRESLFALLPFSRVNDETHTYAREKTLAGGAWASAYEDLEESAGTSELVSVQLKRIFGQIDIDNFMVEVQSNLNNQRELALRSKLKGITRDFKMALVNGSVATNPKMFDGMKALTPAGQTLTAGTNGNPVSFAMLDELKDAVKLGADVLMMRQGTWRAIKALIRTMGGNTAEHVMLPNFSMPVPAYDGTPIIINEFLPGNEVMGSNSLTGSIYALRLNEADGFHGIYGGDAAGFSMEKVGLHQSRDSTRYRVKWYVAACLRATHAIARIQGVTNI